LCSGTESKHLFQGSLAGVQFGTVPSERNANVTLSALLSRMSMCVIEILVQNDVNIGTNNVMRNYNSRTLSIKSIPVSVTLLIIKTDELGRFPTRVLREIVE